MDRLDIPLATVVLDRLDAVYLVRAKLFQVGLRLTGHADVSAQLAAEFSDLGRQLIAQTTRLDVAFSLSMEDNLPYLQTEFRFDDWSSPDHGQRVRSAGWMPMPVDKGWALSRKHRLETGLSAARLGQELTQILTTKTREELFDDLNAKNRQLHIEIEERQVAQANALQAQRDLIAHEKLAALGGLVAGIAHEINTPVGIGVTAASHLSELIRDFAELYKTGGMRRSDLDTFLQAAQESNSMVEDNLLRASKLIRSFKEVAVDQTADDEREFNLREYAEHVLTTLSPALRNRAILVSLEAIDPSIRLRTAPGPISQILTNLIMNSLIHAFDQDSQGHIRIAAQKQANGLELVYQDDGKGISAEHLQKIFEPFFTTKRSHGGSGLGMHLVYNLVTKKYSGTIRCESALGQGVTFVMSLPMLLVEPR